MLKHGTLVLMIDTSIYEDDSKSYLKCYQEFFKNDTEIDQPIDISSLKEYQIQKIKEVLEKYKGKIKKIIFVGHHPILYLKYKEEKNKTQKDNSKKDKSKTEKQKGVIIRSDINIKSLLEEIYISGVKYYYLCSDLHLYQKGKLTIDFGNDKKMEIQQYIVGTGGTKLDYSIPVDKYKEYDIQKSEFMENGIIYKFEEEKAQYGFLECVNTARGPSFEFINAEDTSISWRDALMSSYPNFQMFGGKNTKKQNKKRKYSRKHRGGGGQCSSLGCKDDEIPDSDKIVMANDFLNQNINNYDYAKTNNKNKDSYISVLQKIYNFFPDGIDGNTNLVEAFEKPKNANLFSSNCNMFRDNLLDRLKNGYMEELKRKKEFIVVLSVVERKLITQQNKEDFEKEFNENKAAAEENERQENERQENERQENERQENERQENERQRLEMQRLKNERTRQTAKNNPFTQNKTDRDTRRNKIGNIYDIVTSTTRNRSQNNSRPPK
jgi:hypothetical protein